jgi:hypothetical protein
MRLIFNNIAGKVPPYAQRNFQHFAIHHSHVCRAWTGRTGECRFAAAVGDPETGTATSEAASSRSLVLDMPDQDLETMEDRAGHCATRYCCELAAAAIQTVLVEAVPEQETGTAAGLPKFGHWFGQWR